MNERSRLLKSIASTIEDYEAGALGKPNSAHVEKWVNQFPPAAQDGILAEMDHVLKVTYFSKADVETFLKTVINHQNWHNGDPKSFWQDMHFLNVQPVGNSQRALLKIFGIKLNEALGLSFQDCAKGDKFLYLDDGLFSGGRIRSDLKTWIENVAPAKAELYIATIAVHEQGRYFKGTELKQAVADSKKNITIKWYHAIRFEDGIFQEKVNISDVLRPRGPGADLDVEKYIGALGKAQMWRMGTSVGAKNVFSSDAGRHLLEQEFLTAGVAIRKKCPNLGIYQRPLGNTTMRTIGFGTLFATYRNCPNNAPLVLWAGDPWYPLLPRITN